MKNIKNLQQLVGHLGMRTIPMYSENAERSSKRVKENTMAYIISGISNGKPFLMSDCIATHKDKNKNKTYHYSNKLNRLISTEIETYFCFAGSDSYGYAVNCFDRECYEKNKSFDFRNEEHITEVLEIFRYIKEYRIKQGFKVDNYARLYFVTKTDVYFYQFNDDGKLTKLQNIGNDNYYIEPRVTDNYPTKLGKQFNNNQELIDFCKEEILKVQDYNIDLKDKFSYVIFNGNEIMFNNSVKTNKTLVFIKNNV
jgi:hypothetical protein